LECILNELIARGNEYSPILFVGHSLPNNPTVRGGLREILGRRHIIYNSIIIPIAYYMNEYLEYSHSDFRLPNGFRFKQDINNWSISHSDNDIFRYMNAFLHTAEDLNANFYGKYFIHEEITIKIDGKKQKKEITKVRNDEGLKQEIDNGRMKIILCMGTEVFLAIKDLLVKEYSMPELTIPMAEEYFNNRKKTKEKKGLGIYFSQYVARYRENGLIKMPHGGEIIILPILHNSSNLAFSDTDIFFASQNENYMVYFQYIAEQLCGILKSMYKNNQIDENYINFMKRVTKY
jgi:hypothetical protein